ncbi:hypothetical protein N7453_007231 [Penicillium expansum]|nr:hypothetical protein N7453_007231 [Penicillium expansum]
MQYALLAVITGAVLINLKTFPGVWHLLLSLFPRLPRWAPIPDSATKSSETDADKSKKREKTVSIALGRTSCVFKREIKPLQRYEVWSRVLSWDAKWLVLVSYFVKAGTHKSVMRSLQKGNQNKEGSDAQKAILAVAVTRYVFKDGRRTAPPEEVLQCVGLYPSTFAEADEQDIYDNLREPGSDALGFFGSLDSLASNFGDASSSILGSYSDL